MEETIIYLKKDKTCFINIETGMIDCQGDKQIIKGQVADMLVYLLKHKEERCEYADIFSYMRDNSSDMHKKYDSSLDDGIITDTRKKITVKLKKDFGITVSSEVNQIENADITIINIGAAYQLYLGVDYLSTDKVEIIKSRFADYYFDEFKKIFPRDNDKKSFNADLLDIFCFPRFVSRSLNEEDDNLNLANDNNVYICAPNGFGKSTLLKMLILATNPSNEVYENKVFQDKINEVRKTYTIDKNYLSLFIDLKEYNADEMLSFKENIYDWLLHASKLNKVFSVEDFKRVVDISNSENNLLIAIDGLDEMEGISRSEIMRIVNGINGANGCLDNAQIIIASRPLVNQIQDRTYKYLYIDLMDIKKDEDKINLIIEKFSKNDKDVCYDFICKDQYLINMVVTPQLLTELIVESIQEIHAQEDYQKKGKHGIINSITRQTILRSQRRTDVSKGGNNEKLFEAFNIVYEKFAYASLFKVIENIKGDIGELTNIVSNENEGNNRRVEKIDVIDVYEVYSLLNTTNDVIDFLAPQVWLPYYLAKAVYSKSYKEDADKEIWEMFDNINLNRKRDNKILFDTLVYFFALTHEEEKGLLREKTQSIWVDYVNKIWEENRDRDILIERLKYLLKDGFVGAFSYLQETILAPEKYDKLEDNEKKLKEILVSILK